jgi:hypothetical protein
MTRVEQVLEMIAQELTQRCFFLNAEVALRSLSVIIKFNVRTGQPRSVLVLPEVGRDMQSGQETYEREKERR